MYACPGRTSKLSVSSARRYFARIFVARSASGMSTPLCRRASRRVGPISNIWAVRDSTRRGPRTQPVSRRRVSTDHRRRGRGPAVAASQSAISPSQRPTRAAPSPPLRPSVRWAVSRPRRASAIAKSPSAAASTADAHARTSVISSKKREAAMASGHDGDRGQADDERCGGAWISRPRQLHRGHCLT